MVEGIYACAEGHVEFPQQQSRVKVWALGLGSLDD